MNTDDPRCCGSGTCIINDDGQCWCGQVWNGDRMVAPGAARAATDSPAAEPTDAAPSPTAD
jgi:hypothetical protein